MEDTLGKPIEVGDLVAVAVSSGRSAGTLSIGWVTKLAPKKGDKFSIRFPEKPVPGRSWQPRGGTSLYYYPGKIINLKDTPFEWPENWMEQ